MNSSLNTDIKTNKESKYLDAIYPENLGSAAFKKSFGIKYAYYTGAMYRGIASKELVVCMGKASLLGFLGTAGMSLDQIKTNIDYIQKTLSNKEAYGMNLLCHLDNPDIEMSHVEIYLEKGVECVEAAAFMQITKALALYRIKGLSQSDKGKIIIKNKIVAKISHPEVARAFMSPVPKDIVQKLLLEQRITELEAELSQQVPMSYDICVEADSGGHTDQGIALALLPAIKSIQLEMQNQYAYPHKIRVGLAGGLGSPEAVAAAFIMGADFVCTGSINQCTVEAGTSDAVKELLQNIAIQDTDYAPAGDMFKIGAKVQVLKKGTFFPGRANKLFVLYNHYNSLNEIPEKIQTQIQGQYFKRTFSEILKEIEDYFLKTNRPEEVVKLKTDEKYKMERVFVWYFNYTMRLSFEGDPSKKVDFQVHCGPAMGSFNQWVKGSSLENWKNRHVDDIAEKLMISAADIIYKKSEEFRQAANIDLEGCQN